MIRKLSFLGSCVESVDETVVSCLLGLFSVLGTRLSSVAGFERFLGAHVDGGNDVQVACDDADEGIDTNRRSTY
jgi:hypothetical protein